jgi:hypothetical protein
LVAGGLLVSTFAFTDGLLLGVVAGDAFLLLNVFFSRTIVRSDFRFTCQYICDIASKMPNSTVLKLRFEATASLNSGR